MHRLSAMHCDILLCNSLTKVSQFLVQLVLLLALTRALQKRDQMRKIRKGQVPERAARTPGELGNGKPPHLELPWLPSLDTVTGYGYAVISLLLIKVSIGHPIVLSPTE